MKRRNLFITVAVIHLGLVAIGAAEIDLLRFGWVGQALRWYGALSGSTSAYSFFAPGVGTELRASFEVTERDGRQVVDDLAGGAGREIDLRVGNIIGVMWDQVDNERARRAITASWAAKVLARHAGARRVKVNLEEYDLPTMGEYRDGAKPRWDSFYQATFVHRPNVVSER